MTPRMITGHPIRVVDFIFPRGVHRPQIHTGLVVVRRTKYSGSVSEMMSPLLMEARRYAQDFR